MMSGHVVRHLEIEGPSGDLVFEIGVGLEEASYASAAAAIEAIASARGGSEAAGRDPS